MLQGYVGVLLGVMQPMANLLGMTFFLVGKIPSLHFYFMVLNG